MWSRPGARAADRVQLVVCLHVLCLYALCTAYGTEVLTCPAECICLSQSQVLCNTGHLTAIPLATLPHTVEQLSLNKNHFPVIKTEAFAGLRNLQTLSLDGNNITSIRPFAFRGLPRLKELSIQRTPLQSIGQFSFAGLHNMTAIVLTHNKITRVDASAFAGTTNVRLILLAHNPIVRINTSAFSALKNVDHLILPNGIRVIESDAFSGLEQVGLLKLPFMDLDSLRPYTFRGLSRVNVLSIQESDLGIVRTNAFHGISHVNNLNIINNKIDAIQELKLRYNYTIKILRFHGNHLLETPAPDVISFDGVDTLSVRDNHFPCDCHVHTLLESPLANGTQQASFASRNYCISPMEYNGKSIQTLDLDSIGRCQDAMTKENLAASIAHQMHFMPAFFTLNAVLISLVAL